LPEDLARLPEGYPKAHLECPAFVRSFPQLAAATPAIDEPAKALVCRAPVPELDGRAAAGVSGK